MYKGRINSHISRTNLPMTNDRPRHCHHHSWCLSTVYTLFVSLHLCQASVLYSIGTLGPYCSSIRYVALNGTTLLTRQSYNLHSQSKHRSLYPKTTAAMYVALCTSLLSGSVLKMLNDLTYGCSGNRTSNDSKIMGYLLRTFILFSLWWFRVCVFHTWYHILSIVISIITMEVFEETYK